MITPRLALLPAAWLALSAAAAPSLNAVAECRASHAEMRAAIAKVPLNRQSDESKPPLRNIANYFGGPMPQVYGFQAIEFGSTDMLETDSERYMVITRVDAPFDQVRAAALKVHGENGCAMQGERGCIGTLRQEADGWEALLVILPTGDRVSVGCAYIRTPE